MLIQPTPSGGRHYFVFFSNPYALASLHGLLEAAGLKHLPGEIEFFPSRTNGLRLPFGYMPGRPHDPRAWIQFIDDYRNERIERFNLNDLRRQLIRNQSSEDRHLASLAVDEKLTEFNRRPSVMGMPKAHQAEGKTYPGCNSRDRSTALLPGGSAQPGTISWPKIEPSKLDQFRRLIDSGPHSIKDADQLLDLGICLPGTRNQVLNHLAAHLIWVRKLSCEQATEKLTAWTLDPRHHSFDVQSDLAGKTNCNRPQIQRMCKWYDSHRKLSISNPKGPFALEEMASLWTSLKPVPRMQLSDLTDFLLRFLDFAKLYGRPTSDQKGWAAAPAVRQIIRRWPNCHHMNYKNLIELAISIGVLKITKGSWHPKGRPGRARTYSLAVPVVAAEECSFSLEQAKAWLLLEERIDAVEVIAINQIHLNPVPGGKINHGRSDSSGVANDGINNATNIHSPCAGAGVESSALQCNHQPNATLHVPGKDHGTIPASCSRESSPTLLSPRIASDSDELVLPR
jgi:hypothetical protein